MPLFLPHCVLLESIRLTRRIQKGVAALPFRLHEGVDRGLGGFTGGPVECEAPRGTDGRLFRRMRR